MNKFFGYIKKHKIISSVILIIIIAGGVYYWYTKAHASGTVRYITQPAQIQTLTTAVTSTGQVAASDQVDIKPSSTATVTSVKVKQGDQVSTGQVLLTLDETTASQQLEQAKASLESAQANYQNVEAGATSDDVQLAKLSLQSSQQNLTNDQTNLQTVTQEQQTDVTNAFQTLLNSNLQLSASDTLTTTPVTLSGEYTGTQKGQYTISIQQAGSGYVYTVSGLGSESGQITPGLQQPLGNGLYITFGTTGNMSLSTTWTVNVPNTTGSSYQNNLNSYSTALQNQQTAIQSAQNKITSDQNALQQAQIQYDQKVEPPTQAQTTQAEAQVAQAQASYNNALQTYDNNIITSPINGTVANVNVSVGDQANSGSSGATETDLMTIVTPQQLADISLNEVDAAKVQEGDKATMTFDALSGVTMTGTVSEIDTVGTVSQGVVTYNAQVAFDTNNDQIKPGMSVDVSIITKAEPNVLTVPSSAVKTDSSGNAYVQILGSDGKPQNVTVQVGDSNNTDTVITSGISSGQNVITQTINTAAKAASTTASSGASLLGGAGGATRTFTTGGGAGGFTGGAARSGGGGAASKGGGG